MAFVVYMTRLVSDENLKIGDMASQFLYHDFIELGYFCCHFSAARSSSPKGEFFAGCAVYPAEVVRERLAVFVAYIFQRVPDLMYNASLIFGLRKAASMASLMPVRPVGTDDKDVFYASVLKLVKDRKPVLRALVLPNVDAKNVLVSLADMPRTIYAAFLRTPTSSLTA